jgi:molecular chaperone GrpE
MTDSSRRVPIKVKVVDKRKSKTETDSEVDRVREPEAAAPPARSGKPFSSAPLGGDTAASGESDPSSLDAGVGSSAGESAFSGDASAGVAQVEAEEESGERGHDYLDDLRRLQAEFDNFRKRTFRERQQLEARGKRRLVEALLPVLDNFERAISHGEGGAGVEMVFKELRSSFEAEGLAEIPAEGKPFDPQVHEAVESVEDPDVEEPVVTQVYRRGYAFGDELVRPAMVVVARPAERGDEPEAADGSA